MYRDSIDRYQFQTVPTALNTRKRIGSYLEEAGLVTRAQIDVALNDQKATGMRFGEVLAARGWVKQQTIEYLMKKIVVPERRSKGAAPQNADRNASPSRSVPPPPPPQSQASRQSNPSQKPDSQQQQRREVPISKPLPSVPSSDGDVNWVG
ncbi:MAG TPA: hypothetical protein ACFE0H_08355 [Elainellaceae cyanobacterium]|jgi:uncharacterized membrane protein